MIFIKEGKASLETSHIRARCENPSLQSPRQKIWLWSFPLPLLALKNQKICIKKTLDTDPTIYTYGGANAPGQAAGKILKVQDASGTLEYEYGFLGEVTKETRTLRTHLNGYYPTETAVMEYRSDYLGRMQWIVYPDGEKVTYGYDQGGQVISVTGKNYNHEFNYVTNILYDQYGQRTRIDYGNGTFTEYKYDPERRWLKTIKTHKADKLGNVLQTYQNITYDFDAVGNVLGYENNCLDNVTGNYKTRQTYSYDNLYQLIRVEGETTYDPYRSSVPEFVSNYSQDFSFDELGLGNMTSKVSKESVRPNKKIGDNLNYNFEYIYDENFAHRLVRAGDRYYKYDSNGNIICEQDGSFESNGNDTAYHKIEQETDDVYSTDYGWGLFKEDKTGSTTSRYRRTYIWNERNQLISSVDANYSTAYVYGQDGQRSNKYTGNSETLYFNKMWTHHTDSGNSIYGGQTSKNIYLGETRIITKLNSGEDPTYQEEYYKQYYYHSDHLGSASMISDYKGDEYQRIEYTPYGETWVEKTSNTGLEYLPYKFTAKELDEETGLYYYGARYLDPKYSMWISCDPALSDYMAGSSAGCGGIYSHINLNLYHYAGNNPLRYVDPDGRKNKDSVLDWIQGGLDAVGLVPGVGEIADGVNGVISLCRGDFVAAGLSFVSMVPVVGDAIGKGGKAVKQIVKHGDDIIDAGKQVLKHADDGLLKATKGASKTISDAAKTKGLHRPYIRKSTREAVENAAQKNAKGQFIDPNTLQPIEGKYDLGHKRGNEFRTEKAKAEREGLTQSQFNDRMNNPDLYQIENPSSNRSHKYEAPRE